MTINVQRKIASLLRRKVPFVGLTFDPQLKTITLLQSFSCYRKAIEELKQMGMCKHSQRTIQHGLQVNGLFFDVVLISYGDIRQNKMIYGESPLSAYFGICMFDYVFMFVVKPQS